MGLLLILECLRHERATHKKVLLASTEWLSTDILYAMANYQCLSLAVSSLSLDALGKAKSTGLGALLSVDQGK